jgi:hypothetical protein
MLICKTFRLRAKPPNGLALPALGRGRRSRPTGKMIRLEKCLRFSPESPASGARCVSLRLIRRPIQFHNKPCQGKEHL